MSTRIFGTDGIRGRVGEHPMTAEFVLRLASAAGQVLAPAGGKVLIGKDTRVSGYLFESALEAGFVAAGMDVLLVGPLPTPGIAYLTRFLGADVGVVISASHNPHQDNGIKFFDANGSKLSDEIEAAIEAQLLLPSTTRESSSLGRAKRVDNALELYQAFCLTTVAPGFSLDGMKIVIDCSHGAAYKVAPRVLSELGAEVVPIGCSPNGRNINDSCGSTNPELLQLTTGSVRADVGIALDGDGDRVLMVDHLGQLVDGDQLLWILASAWARTGQLRGPVIGTLMSNLGLEMGLKNLSVEFQRSQVGDRYVLEMLRETGGRLGGETSGHILCLDRTTTGDGLVSALQVLSVLRESGQTLAQLAGGMARFPQKIVNVRVHKTADLAGSLPIQSVVTRAELQLRSRGRVVLRSSGTEPLVRVMVEGENREEVNQLAEEIAAVVRQCMAC